MDFTDDERLTADTIRKLRARCEVAEARCREMEKVARCEAAEARCRDMEEVLETIAGGHYNRENGGPDIMAVDPATFRGQMWEWSQKMARAALDKG